MDQIANPDQLPIVVRPATADDAPLLARLRYAFRSRLDATTESEEDFVRRCQAWMQVRLQENSNWQCWIAEMEATAVGHLWMQLIEKIPNPVVEPEFHAYITNVYVRDEARGRGAGSRLITTAVEWAKARDVQAVILWPTEKSRPLYERHGFAMRDDLLELMLTP